MKFKSIAFPIGWAILVFLLCHLPGKDLPELNIIGMDKLVHFSLFTILSLSIFWNPYFTGKSLRNKIVSWTLIQIIYGISLELYQGQFVPDRTADPFDALANSVGVFIGLYLNFKLKRRIL